MHRPPSARSRFAAGTLLAAAAAVIVACAAESRGVEMFTFFGDGSRIGLPSLEVPVEAYPGIPLRSDRIRARRAARRQAQPVVTAPTQPALPRGITIRQMPDGPQPRVQPAARRAAATDEPPLPPSPEDVLPGAVRPPLAE